LTSADYDHPVGHRLRHVGATTSHRNKLRMGTLKNQREGDTVGVRRLSGSCINDQIGQDCRLPIAENPAATGCSEQIETCASERVSERANEANKCLLSLHTRLRYLNECCNLVVVDVASSLFMHQLKKVRLSCA